MGPRNEAMLDTQIQIYIEINEERGKNPTKSKIYVKIRNESC
jgi:hypothetical protein